MLSNGDQAIHDAERYGLIVKLAGKEGAEDLSQRISGRDVRSSNTFALMILDMALQVKKSDRQKFIDNILSAGFVERV